MDFPPHFRCPISMEFMKDPVTISTGVTYERNYIEKWLFTYNKKTCPATMQRIENYDITPNHTLKRLILTWQNGQSQSGPLPQPSPSTNDELTSLLHTVETAPFKVGPLKKLRFLVEKGDEIRKADFVRSGGVTVLVRIVVQVLTETMDFLAFRASEEALGVLHRLPLSEENETIQLLSKPESMKSMVIILQRGSAEARFCAVAIFREIAKAEYDWNFVVQDQGVDILKALLELISDEMWTRGSSCALEVLIEILEASKKSRQKAVEAGAVCVLVELLPDSNRSKCEKIFLVIKLLCGCAEGRLALAEHRMGIAAISKKTLEVSNAVTKIGVKILWLVCNFHPTERVLEDMIYFGSVKKLLALLHIDGRSSAKDRVVKILKLHGNSWRRYPCCPCELKECWGSGNDYC